MAASSRQQPILRIVAQCRMSRMSTQGTPVAQICRALQPGYPSRPLGRLSRQISTTHSWRQDNIHQVQNPAQTATANLQRAQPPPSTPPPPPNPPTRRKGPCILFAAAFILLGTVAGSSVRLLLQPPVPPAPESDADAYTTDIIRADAARLPIVAQLSSDPAWDSWPAYADIPPAQAADHLTAGALAGSRGLGGYQQVFRRRGTGEIAVVTFLGPAVAGWPAVAHGGCLAAVLDETCGRAAAESLADRAAVTARLAVSYARATMTNGFYVVRARVRAEEELEEAERGKRAYKAYVDATLEDAVSGQVCVVAEALFVAPKSRKKDPDGSGVAEFGLLERF